MVETKIKAGDSNGYLKMETWYNKTKQMEGYFELYSGNIYTFGDDCNVNYRNVYIRRLKWQFYETVLIPIRDFEDRKFFHVDVYKLAVDTDAKPFKLEPLFADYFIKGKDMFNIESPRKYVKYVKTKDRFKNLNDPTHIRIVD